METNKPSFWQSKKRQDVVMSWILYIVAWTGALIFVTPLVWMISTSLKAPDDIFKRPPKWFPQSDVVLKYDVEIKAQREGRAVVVKTTEGGHRIEIGGWVHSVPAEANLKVAKSELIKKGQIIAIMPKSGKVVFGEEGKNRVIKVIGSKGGSIREYQILPNTKLKVKEGQEVKPGTLLAVINPQWQNYVRAWAPEALDETFNRYLMNTVIITVMGIIGVIFSSTLVAYGFARFRFPGKDVLFLIMISTMMIPVQVTMIPTFILFKYIGWIDTFLPLIVPTFFGGGAFNIFLMRQFFLTIPFELDEAAKIDGCNYLQTFYIILMPLVKPALVTVSIFGFVYNWNDFLNPLIYLNSSSNYTLALGLQTFTTMYGTDYNLMMAASTIVLLPILIVFFFGQRYFIEGVATSGLKG